MILDYTVAANDVTSDDVKKEKEKLKNKLIRRPYMYIFLTFLPRKTTWTVHVPVDRQSEVYASPKAATTDTPTMNPD